MQPSFREWAKTAHSTKKRTGPFPECPCAANAIVLRPNCLFPEKRVGARGGAAMVILQRQNFHPPHLVPGLSFIYIFCAMPGTR